MEFSSKAVRSLPACRISPPTWQSSAAAATLPLWRTLLPSLFKCCGEQAGRVGGQSSERVDFGKHLHLVVRALLSRMKKVTKDVRRPQGQAPCRRASTWAR